MTYQKLVETLADDPEQLEQTYQAALKAGQADAFKQAIDTRRTAAPDNLLYAAWFHRLHYAAAQAKGAFVKLSLIHI